MDKNDLILEYQHDKNRPHADAAKQALETIGALVWPIMRHRSWKVGKLCEFYPAQHQLLGCNINRGSRICLRLRCPRNEKTFLPLAEVLDTMLHELSHMVYGAHDTKFHALWNELRVEYERRVCAKAGVAPENFMPLGPGGRMIPMGTNGTAKRARAAGEKLRERSWGSGAVLGGMDGPHGADMKRLLAEAAERRRDNVTRGCGSGLCKGARSNGKGPYNGFKTKEEEDDANVRVIIELYGQMVWESEDPFQEKVTQTTSQRGNGAGPWCCAICTCHNDGMFLCCGACGAERGSQPPKPTHCPKAPSKPSKVSAPRAKTAVAPSKPSKDCPHRSQASTHPQKAPYPVHHPQANPAPLPSRRATIKTTIKACSQAHTSTSKPQVAVEQSIKLKNVAWVCLCGIFFDSRWTACASCGSVNPVH